MNKNITWPIIVVLIIILAHGYLLFSSQRIADKSAFSFLHLNSTQQLEKHYQDNYGPLYRQFQSIKAMTPAQCMIIFPPMKGEALRVGNAGLASFFLFPRHLVYAGDRNISNYKGPIYRMTVNNQEVSVVRLKESAEGFVQADVEDFTQLQMSWVRAVHVFIRFLSIILCGALFLLWCRKKWALGQLALNSILVGIVFNVFLQLLSNLLGYALTGFYADAVLLVFALGGAIQLARNKASISMMKSVSVIEQLCLFVVGIVFAFLFVKAYNTPIMAWDACAIWGAKAKAFFAFGDLRAIFNYGAHPQYPPLLTVFMGQMGIGGEGVVQLIAPLMYLCLYLIIADELRNLGLNRLMQILLPVVLLLVPIFAAYALRTESVLVLAVFLTKALMLLSKYKDKGDIADFKLLILVLCGLVMVRLEGYVYALLIIIPLIKMAGERGLPRRLLFLIVVPFLMVLMWALLCVANSSVSWSGFLIKALGAGRVAVQVGPNFLNPSYMVETAIHFFSSFLNLSAYGVIPLLFIVILLFRPRNLLRSAWVEVNFLAVIILGMLGFMVFVAPLGGREEPLLDSLLRYNMIFIPIMFIALLKEFRCFFNAGGFRC